MDTLSRYSLAIWNSPYALDVLNFRGEEQLSETFSYTVDVTCPAPDIGAAQILRQFASFTMGTPFQPERAVYRLVGDFWRLSSSANQSLYRLELLPSLRLLENSTNSFIFQNQSVPDVVEFILRKHGLEGQDFEFRLSHAYPDRELITQWGETDLQFIKRILAEVGIWFRFEADTRLTCEKVLFGDGPEQYRFGVTLPYCEPSGMSDGHAESVWGLKIHWNAVTGKIFKRDYNYREATTPLGPYLVTSDESPGPSREISCEVDGEVKQKADTSDLVFDAFALVSYISTVITLEPGDVIATGTPGGVGNARNPKEFLRDGGVMITRIAGLGECRNVCRRETR